MFLQSSGWRFGASHRNVFSSSQAGRFFNALEFCLVPNTRLLRARLAQPCDCWINIIDFASQKLFAEPARPSSQVHYHPLKHDGTDARAREILPVYVRQAVSGYKAISELLESFRRTGLGSTGSSGVALTWSKWYRCLRIEMLAHC